LTALPPIPGNVHNLVCFNNFLSCLPLLPNSLTKLGVCGNNLTCVPNIPVGMQWDTTNCPGFTLPICTDNNSTCYYPFISGNAYIDANNNCQFDNGEAPLANQIIQLNNSLYALTDSNGHYIANTDTGTY